MMPTIESPCVRNCCLDDEDICLGCGRHIAEIMGWLEAGKTDQELILLKATQRRKQREEKFQRTSFRNE